MRLSGGRRGDECSTWALSLRQATSWIDMGPSRLPTKNASSMETFDRIVSDMAMESWVRCSLIANFEQRPTTPTQRLLKGLTFAGGEVTRACRRVNSRTFCHKSSNGFNDVKSHGSRFRPTYGPRLHHNTTCRPITSRQNQYCDERHALVD